jgi:hypothetical protein
MKNLAACNHCRYKWETRVLRPKSCPKCKHRESVVLLKRKGQDLNTIALGCNEIALSFTAGEMRIFENYAKKNNIYPVKTLPKLILENWLKTNRED